MARIVVTGYMVRHPLAGNVAAYLQYVVGLKRLGHEVLYLEEKGWPYSCYDPGTGLWNDAPTTGLSLVRSLVATQAPGVVTVYADAERGVVDGMPWADLRAWLSGCDLMLDIGGVCWLDEAQLAPRRALVDIDPLFTQVKGFASEVLDQYHVHFSYGTNLGKPNCTVPTAGCSWSPTVPPVVPDLWSARDPSPQAPFTTIANWSAYGSVEHEDVVYGQKDVEFARLRDLPATVESSLELALSGADDDVRRSFRDAGWSVRDGGEVTATLGDYREYIAASQGELSPAKHAYVSTRSGWFSDRTVCYLAAGRPAILQDTGFTDWLPSGAGVIAFSDPEEAAEAVERVHRELPAQAEAARAVAARFFDARVVLPRLVDRALAGTPATT